MQPLKRLWVIYDPKCGLCSRVKEWIGAQPALVPLELLAADSMETKSKFPQVPAGELAVIGDTGEVWLGNRAWLVCLWALRDYRDWAVRLSSPVLMPVARQAFASISSNRAAISKLLGLPSEQEMVRQLREVAVPGCEISQR